jgi:hypothetical protein
MMSKLVRTVKLAMTICALSVLAAAQASVAAAGPSNDSPSPQTTISPARAHALGYSLTPSTTEPYAACGVPSSTSVACQALVIPPGARRAAGEGLSAQLNGSALPSYEGSGEGGGLSPGDLRSAYGIPATGGSGQTIAIVDAYSDPHIEEDLNTYRSHYGLSECSIWNGCLHVDNQKGEEREYPAGNEGWAFEVSLDVDMASAICPECHILLVEANNTEYSNLDAAENTAAAKATEVSDSWGGPELAAETELDANYNHPGIPITVSAGDYGYIGAFYPAASQYVISVGGTQLKKAESSRGWEESVWAGSGGGCSLYESKPGWQGGPSCAKRMDNDVAAVASLESPVSVYDSYLEERPGWQLVGGTSVAAPIVAGVEAHATSTVRSQGAQAFYTHSLFDVTTGSNGHCGGSYLCTGLPAYDGPTGWGTPDGSLELALKFAAVTEAATSVTASTAKLNGYVSPAGLETTYHFEYGPTTSYGMSVPVPEASVGFGAGWRGVSQSIIGLHTLHGTYHYRLVATNSSGTLYGEDKTFTTTPWAVQGTPKPAESEYGYSLNAVSCSSSTACTAVSSYDNKASGMLALVEGWNGSEWKIQSTPNPSGSKYVLPYAVSCTSSSACTTVGFYINSSEIYVPLAERWNGTAWSVQSTPTPTGSKHAELRGVSCVSASECMAVGDYTTESTVALAERWNGTEWVSQIPPNPAGAKQSTLSSVSCASSSECIAVGSYLNSSNVEVLFSEGWNGTAWSIQTTPAPTGSEQSTLHSVSCVSAKVCTAIGASHTASAGWVNLAERWSGTAWSIQIAPATQNSYWRFGGVSCASSSECIVVAGQSSARWNGSEWTSEPVFAPAEPVGYEAYELRSVSCLASKVCIGVGSDTGEAAGGFGSPGSLAESRVIKPYASTGQATGVSETGATLRGTVNPEEGPETKYYFEYGPTVSYGSKTTEVGVGEGTGNLEESKAITGLSLGTYHFRIVATSAEGTTDGVDQAFATFVAKGPKLQPVKGTGAFPLAFTASSGSVALGSSGGTLRCKTEAGVGKFTSTKEGRLTLTWSECEMEGAKCGNKGAGVVETKELKTLLAYTYPAKATSEGRETGVVLSPASGVVVAEFKCGALANKIEGSLIATARPLRTKGKTLTLVFKQANGVQEPLEYETESGGVVATGMTCTNGELVKKCAEEAGSTITLTNEEATLEA